MINSDLHCHPSLKGAVGDQAPELIWKAKEAKKKAFCELSSSIRMAIEDIARDSQTHLDTCVEGNARLLFVSIYPFERPFLKIERRKPFKTLFKLILPKKKYNILGEAVLGIPREEIRRRLDEASSGKGVNYFEEYQEELDYLVRATETQSDHDTPHTFHLAKDYEDYQSLIRQPNTIVGILSVEGIHSLGNYAFSNPFERELGNGSITVSEEQSLEESFLQNIISVKSEERKGAIPLFITFSHHFNNLLAGHAQSLSDCRPLSKFLRLNLPGMRHLFKQEPFMGKGFSDVGKKVLNALLSKDNGRRILIDTKHMSVKAREEFYQILSEDYQGDPIPIVHSHGAVSGIETLAQAKTLTNDYQLDEGSFFSKWSINLTDEDIRRTFESNGLLGLCLHEGRMPGEKFKKAKKELEKAKNVKGIEQLYLKLFCSQLFHVARIQQECPGDRGHWQGITIGSDYDGIVDPFDPYQTTGQYPRLRKDMVDYLIGDGEIIDVKTQEVMTSDEKNRIMDGHNPDELIEMLFFKNADSFLSVYFRKEYLLKKENEVLMA